MIEIKGTRTQEAESNAAQRYFFKNASKKSKTPAILAISITGLALYLKSLFPGSAEEEGEEAAGSEENELVAEADPLNFQELPPELLNQNPTGTAEEPTGPEGSGGRLLEVTPPMDFTQVETLDLGDFYSPELSWDDFQSLGVENRAYLAANDNSVSRQAFDPVVPGAVVVEKEVDGETDGNDSQTDDDIDDGKDDEADEDNKSATDRDSNDGNCGGASQTSNRAPRVAGPVYLTDVSGCAILAIGLSELLQNATDPDGDALAVQNLTVSSGSITQTDEGWVFQSGPQMLGPVTIFYDVTDGGASVSQTAHFSVVKSRLEGSSGDDALLGSMCADEIDGGSGDDNIDGRWGNDVVVGGDGHDHIVAGAGNDIVFGGNGDDIIFGGQGSDHIAGGAGNDRLFGEDGDDIVFGNDGNDRLSGGHGDDLMSGGAGNDIVAGNSGNDTISGDEGEDILEGGSGNDVVDGGSGDDSIMDGTGEDVVYAGTGNDAVVASLDGENDLYHGGEGCDAIDYSETVEGVAVDLAKKTAVGIEIGNDKVASFEAAYGGSGSDELTGNEGSDTLYGNQGDDLIDGSSGDDVLYDGEGEDTVLGGADNDRFMAAADGDDDHFDGGKGCDTLDYSATKQGVTVNLHSGTACGVEIGEDTISGFETAIGGTGDDYFIAGNAPAVLVGGEGENTFEFPPSQPHETPNASNYAILDFKVGDLIRISKYDLFEEVLDELDDRFEQIYGDDADDNIPIRYRHEWNDEMERTVIEADLNGDDIYEISLSVHGHRELVVSEGTLS
ncbi:calcium-binding protein [Chelativorans sp. YIM 93263]|uniref:calcium-binding protein n=1 Tax=Chelativorans sp. YIM 93263 TaxID=2906648 RepID=UPI0023798F97|nr:cadherin-like domain-containing protein [Chelativorans sp. YIM 93263]